jgi:RimJ/RimL family protein N-acetyltransferase
MTTILATQRLRLRKFTSADLAPIAKMMAGTEQMGYYPRPRTKAEASAWIDRNLGLYDSLGFGFWLIESLASEFLGYDLHAAERPLHASL